ncbi:MAG: ABC transporter permease [Bacillota bacterium]
MGGKTIIRGPISRLFLRWSQRCGPLMDDLSMNIHILKKDKLALAGLVMIIFFVFAAFLAPVLAPYPAQGLGESDLESRLEAPGRDHWFGTDRQGRDLFSRILYGLRISLIAAFGVTFTAILIGVPLGAIAGYYGGLVDEIIMRITDLFLSFPALLLAIIIVSVIGFGLQNAILALVISWWPWYTRLVRGITISLKERAFVEGARSLGISNTRILLKHIVPNCFGPVIIQATVDIGTVILATASLGFIGLGAQPPQPELGLMISEGRDYVLEQWWYATFPGLIIFLLVLSFNLVGDGLRDTFDPRMKR